MRAAMKTHLQFFAMTVLGLAWSISSCGQDTKPAEAPKPAATAETKAEPKPAPTTVKIIMETSKGTLELELDAVKAPISTANFVNYAKKGHYDGTIFHRVIPGFMAQGGGFTADKQQKPTDAPIKNEGQNGLKNDRGTIAMARTPEIDSATSQFFINVVDNEGLNYPSNGGYAVFGKVTKGMDIVDAIVSVPCTKMQPYDRVASFPVEPITIKSVKVAE